MVTFQKFSPSAKIFMVPKVTVRRPRGRWTSRSVDKYPPPHTIPHFVPYMGVYKSQCARSAGLSVKLFIK